MNRRNFILGLGTAATLSGAASVTGATLTDTVTPNADFRVIASQNLEVSKNSDLNEANYENYTNVEPDNFGDTEFNETAGASSPNMSVTDGQSNEDLQLDLATPNNADDSFNNNASSKGPAEGDLPYVNSSDLAGDSNPDAVTGGEGGAAPLEVTNPTGEAQEVTVTYRYGSDVDGSPITEGLVDELFRFYMLDENVNASNGQSGSGDIELISPPSGTAGGNGAVVDSGSTLDAHFTINMDQGIEETLQDAASGEGIAGFSDGTVDDLELLSTVEFGVIE
jgi:hypothetical protein